MSVSTGHFHDHDPHLWHWGGDLTAPDADAGLSASIGTAIGTLFEVPEGCPRSWTALSLPRQTEVRPRAGDQLRQGQDQAAEGPDARSLAPSHTLSVAGLPLSQVRGLGVVSETESPRGLCRPGLRVEGKASGKQIDGKEGCREEGRTGRDWISFHAVGRAILVLRKASPLPLQAFGLRLQSLRVGFSYRGTPRARQPGRGRRGPHRTTTGEPRRRGKRSYWPNLASAWPGVDSNSIPNPVARPVPGHTSGPGVTPGPGPAGPRGVLDGRDNGRKGPRAEAVQDTCAFDKGRSILGPRRKEYLPR